MLFAGRLLYDVLLPSLIAGIVSYQVTSQFGISYFHHPINFVPHFTKAFFVQVIIAGIFFGICAFIFIEILNYTLKFSKGLKIGKPLKGLIGGAGLVGLTLIFSQKYLGLGLESIRATFEGRAMPWYAFIAKCIFTSITLGFGGSGGIITPLLFAGSAAGSLFAGVFHLDTATFAALGFVGLLAGATNTPIAASIMAIEFFGAPIAPYAAIVCVISYFMTGHRSVYPSQIFEIRKSQFIDFETGREIKEAQKEINFGGGPAITIKMLKNFFQRKK